MIRSVRKVLNALLKNQSPNDEGLSTLMCEVKAILNSRLLTKVSDDPNDLQALSPNHLLLLHAGPECPPGIFAENDQFSQKHWRQVQYLSDMSGLLIFRAVAEPRISSKSAKSCEIHKNTRNPAKFARNVTKYMSAQHI